MSGICACIPVSQTENTEMLSCFDMEINCNNENCEDFCVLKCKHLFVHSRKEVRLDLDSGWTPFFITKNLINEGVKEVLSKNKDIGKSTALISKRKFHSFTKFHIR